MAVGWLDAVIDGAREDLPACQQAVDYLASRGVSLDTAQRYGVGYASPTRTTVGSEAWVKWANRNYAHRLVFPLRSTLGQAIGLQTRSLAEKEYQLFYAQPSDLHPFVFGLDVALPAIWARGHVVLVEGVFDALALAPYTDCVLAALRAKPSRGLTTFLRRYARSVTIMLDMDEPGRDGAFRMLNDQQGYSVSVPSYPAHDPAEWVASATPAAVARLLAHTHHSVW